MGKLSRNFAVLSGRCYDIQENVGDANAKQVSLEELQQKSRCAEFTYSGHRKLIKWLTRFY
jgi:hypothetical protein